MSIAPDTIVLIHGLWMTPRSWEGWVDHYSAKGYRVLTPTYPGFEIEVEALRENTDVIAKQTVPETVDYIATQIEELDNPPIIMGHSSGGTLTQLLTARGLGVASVVIDSAPTEGVRVSPPSQRKSFFSILTNPSTFHGAFGYTPEQFHYTFTNTLSREESNKVYERYHMLAPGNWVWAYGLIANFKPGRQETWVDYSLDERAPLLFIAGSEDHIMPASVNRANAAHHCKSSARTDYHEFADRDHWTCGAPGWEAVADYLRPRAPTTCQSVGRASNATTRRPSRSRAAFSGRRAPARSSGRPALLHDFCTTPRLSGSRSDHRTKSRC